MRISNKVIDRVYCNSTVRSSDYRMAENHSHNYYEIYYVTKGNARFFVDDKLFDLHAGDFMVIPPNLVHYNRYITQTTRVNIYFRDKDLRRETNYAFRNLKEKYLETAAMYHTPSSHRDHMDSVIEMMLHEDKVNVCCTELISGFLGLFFCSNDTTVDDLYGVRKCLFKSIVLTFEFRYE